MSDNASLDKLSKDRGTITYVIKGAPPSNSRLDYAGAAAEIVLAFQKWSEVSNFDFAQVLGDDFDISLEFGELPPDTPANALARAMQWKSPDTGQELPSRRIIFSDKVVWNRLWDTSAWNDPGVTLARLFRKITEYDLLTGALHEIGHALGLPHSSSPGAIMQPSIGAFGDTWVCNGAQPLDDDDAEALAALYADPNATPLVPLASGYLIVGSTFKMTPRTGGFAKDVAPLCWGMRSQSPGRPAAAGYGWNPNLQARGYGYLHLHLASEAGVGEHQCVIGGGSIVPTSSLDHWSPLPDPGGHPGGSRTEYQWGRQDGAIRFCARFSKWVDALQTDANSLIYFVLGPKSEAVTLFGYQTAIYTQKFTDPYDTTLRHWLPDRFDPSSLTKSTLATCRTDHDDYKGTDGKYDNANGVASVYWH